MITNLAPRPYVPGCPVKLYGLSTDAKPTEWLGKPIANGSEFNEVDKDKTYIFDADGKRWHIWTRNRGGSGGSSDGGESGGTSTDSDVDEALDTLFPTAGGLDGDDTPSGKTASDSDVSDALDDLFGP